MSQNQNKRQKLEKLFELKAKRILQQKKHENNQTLQSAPHIQLFPMPQTLTLFAPTFSQQQKASLNSENGKYQQKLSHQNQSEKKNSENQSLINMQDYHEQTQRNNLQLQKVNKGFSQNISSIPHKLSIDESVQQKQKLVKLTRFLLKDIDKLKQAMINIQGSLRGIDYLKKRMANDRFYSKRIKQKIKQLRL